MIHFSAKQNSSTSRRATSPKFVLKQRMRIENNYRFFVLAFALLEEQEQLSDQIISALAEYGLCTEVEVRQDLASIAREHAICPEDILRLIFTHDQVVKIEKLDPIIQNKMLDQIFMILK